MKSEAIQKIEEGAEESKESRVPAKPIAAFLANKCGEDGGFAETVMQGHKTLEKCFDFVYGQVKKHLNGNSGWIDDGEVYLMAMDYFRLDDAELERKEAGEKARRKEEAANRGAEEAGRKAREAKEKAAQKAAAKGVADGQLALF